jgi:hypothetical protein
MWLPGKEHIFAKEKNFTFMATATALREAIEKQLQRYRGEVGIDNHNANGNNKTLKSIENAEEPL